jgi:hypothetical protein
VPNKHRGKCLSAKSKHNQTIWIQVRSLNQFLGHYLHVTTWSLFLVRSFLGKEKSFCFQGDHEDLRPQHGTKYFSDFLFERYFVMRLMNLNGCDKKGLSLIRWVTSRIQQMDPEKVKADCAHCSIHSPFIRANRRRTFSIVKLKTASPPWFGMEL